MLCDKDLHHADSSPDDVTKVSKNGTSRHSCVKIKSIFALNTQLIAQEAAMRHERQVH